MKKQIQLITLLVLLIPVVNAQQASRFPIKPGSVWRINYEYSYSCSNSTFIHENGDEEYKYFIDGDTVVGTRTYFKLYKTGILFLDTPFRIEHKYMGALRDSADRFFYMAKEEESEKLLYDFKVDVGDSIYVEGSDMRFPVDNIGTLENGRKKYELYIMSVNCGSANTIIEGIGWLGGILEGNSCSGHPGVRGSYVVCYSEDDQPIYETDHTRCGNPVVCSNVISSVINTVKSIQPEVIILPGSNLRVSLPDGLVGTYDIEIFDATGKINYHKKTELTELIDISNLGKGEFIIRLGNEKNFYATKFVIK